VADLIDRVQKLIAQSSSPYEEEARTAAKMACDLIRAHALVVGTTHPVAASPPPPPRDEPEYIHIRTKYEARCRKCGRQAHIGDWVWWRKGGGTLCTSCRRP